MTRQVYAKPTSVEHQLNFVLCRHACAHMPSSNDSLRSQLLVQLGAGVISPPCPSTWHSPEPPMFQLRWVISILLSWSMYVCMYGAFNNSKLYNYRCKLSSGHRLFRGFGLQNLAWLNNRLWTLLSSRAMAQRCNNPVEALLLSYVRARWPPFQVCPPYYVRIVPRAYCSPAIRVIAD